MLWLGNFNYVGFLYLQVSHEFLVCASVCRSEIDVRCLPHSLSTLLCEERVSSLSPELSDLTRLGGQQIPGIVSVSLVLGGVSGTEITSADHHGWLCI